MRAGAAATAAAVVSLAALKFLPVPWLWIGLTWTVCLLYLVATGRHTAIRLLLLLVATAAALLTVGEAWLWIAWSPRPEEILTPRSFYPAEPVLGWRMRPGVTRAMKRDGARVIYDVRYTIDSSGWRVLPPDTARAAAGCVVLFVDSFTFGQGVNDDQAMPWLVRLRTMGRFRVFSLSAPGFGAEQMLTALERGVVAGLPCRPTHVIYQAIIDHVLRAAGVPDYSRRGPHYALAADGTPVYLGTGWPSRPAAGPLRRRLDEQLGKSRLYAVLSALEPLPSDADFRLYFAILGRFAALLGQRYPGVEFHVVAWSPLGRYAKFSARFLGGLRAVTPHVHLVDDILPGYRADPAAYHNHATDEHPNARAHALLADYVVRCLLHVAPAGGGAAAPCAP